MCRSVFFFDISNTFFLRPSHVTKIGQLILYSCNSTFISSLAKTNIEQTSRTFCSRHLLIIGMIQLVLSYARTRIQVTEFSNHCQSCARLSINKVFKIVILLILNVIGFTLIQFFLYSFGKSEQEVLLRV